MGRNSINGYSHAGNESGFPRNRSKAGLKLVYYVILNFDYNFKTIKSGGTCDHFEAQFLE